MDSPRGQTTLCLRPPPRPPSWKVPRLARNITEWSNEARKPVRTMHLARSDAPERPQRSQLFTFCAARSAHNKSGHIAVFLLTFYGTFHTARSEIGHLLSASSAQKSADLGPCRMESSIKGQEKWARFILDDLRDPGRLSTVSTPVWQGHPCSVLP